MSRADDMWLRRMMQLWAWAAEDDAYDLITLPGFWGLIYQGA